MPRPALRLNW
ncbi:hypothetical protein Patl1_33133 [Pistacia atlantica]|uniref:Uncharacterized protein n=1 Tax=Pistacia atlantica TaxID=434234 RepID=A0ACC1AN90_9ROSI|nr:hypothetical protein Patl1_33133 [Pistacia atlantica]